MDNVLSIPPTHAKLKSCNASTKAFVELAKCDINVIR